MPRRPRTARAFTLVESIAAMVVVGFVATIGAQLTLRASRDYVEAARGAELHATLSNAIDRLDRDLREIRLDPDAADIGPDIDSLTASSITWDTAGGTCSVSLSGTQLRLAEDGDSAVALLDDVSAFTVAAYNDAGSALTLPLSGNACDAIRRIQITITVTRDGRSDTLRTRVFLRATLAGAGT